MTIFEQILPGSAVEDAAEQTLRKWLPTYLSEVERQTGMGRLPMISSWTRVNDLRQFAEDSLPLLLIIAPGLTGDAPTKDGRGHYTAYWRLGVGVVVDAREDPRRVAQAYAAAVRAIFLHRPGLEGFASSVVWEDEGYDDLPGVSSSRDRNMAVARLVFTIGVEQVTTARVGPRVPAVPKPDPTEPYPDWPAVSEVDIQINKEEA